MIDLSNVKHIHCIGIGGIGLSAVAEILLSEGYAVTGSDIKESDITAALIRKGASVFLGHRERNLADADLVVYSAAVAPTNPELAAAVARGLPAVSRAQMLGYLMGRRKYSVAVAGAHGKTTTTSMIALVLKDSGRDPTILVGGNLSEIGGNVRLGGSEYFVTEACEYMDSFLHLAARYAVILNIDSDHLDYFSDIHHIARSFDRFARLVPDDGAVVAFDANPFVSSIVRDLDRRIVTFGFHEHCDYSARDIEFNGAGTPAFTIVRRGKRICRIQLTVPGEHNISNALAAFACCHDMGVDEADIVGTLEAFSGTQRRFDLLGETTGGVKIVDDYAHHPTEIAATIEAARNMPGGTLWILFQPHTYTRT
ncbi:MAG: UDP-N-acetylmuramate--L-alanine ligase, partial [Clostridiales Family XIII bacterium]|nr:UDP-N-acetylmuramate--L-alanine ligase [Clostridiales Family XIII bacterium]